MSRSAPVKSFLTESALWTLSNALGIAIPVGATYLGLHMLMDVPLTRVSLAMSAMALLTLTWGSWSSLVWAQNRMLRASMQIMTVLPGILLLVLAGLGFYIGKGSFLFWLALLGTGVGTVSASFMLARSVGGMRTADSPSRYAIGIGLFPLLATAGAGVVGYLWYTFVSNPLHTDWRSVFSFAFFFVTTLSIVFISTIIPAVTTFICRRIQAPRA